MNDLVVDGMYDCVGESVRAISAIFYAIGWEGMLGICIILKQYQVPNTK